MQAIKYNSEHPFTIVEDGFNNMLRYGMSQWEKIIHTTFKNDYVKVYEMKKKLATVLRNVSKIIVIINLRNSSNQKIEYMVLTCYFIVSKVETITYFYHPS